jgi:glyoxylate reductase
MSAREVVVSDGLRRFGERRVAVTRDLPGDALTRLEKLVTTDCWPDYAPPSRAELTALAASADGLLTMITDRIDGEFLDACPNLRVVSNMAVGVDNLDLGELTKRGIPVGHTPGVLTDATADLAFALILASARRIVETRDAILAGDWTTWHPSAFLGLELSGATLGVVGTGEIGRAVIARAKGFNMRVVAMSRTRREIPGVTYLELPELLATADIVTLHVALTPATRHLIGAPEFARMKQGAILVNTARGPIVDQVALNAALDSGQLGAAGLDVFETEPVPLNEPLLHRPNCVVVPHIGSATVRTRAAMADLAVDNLLAGLAGERLLHCANPEVYETA